MQAVNITTNQKLKINVGLPNSSRKVLMWGCHVENTTESRCDIIIGRDLLS